MIKTLKCFFEKNTAVGAGEAEPATEHDVRVATCALFLEMARIDETFSDAEMDTILSILKEKYGLSREHADALLAEADKELAQSVDLWQFARLIKSIIPMMKKSRSSKPSGGSFTSTEKWTSMSTI